MSLPLSAMLDRVQLLLRGREGSQGRVRVMRRARGRVEEAEARAEPSCALEAGATQARSSSGYLRPRQRAAPAPRPSHLPVIEAERLQMHCAAPCLGTS